jgi:hypothetical protein
MFRTLGRSQYSVTVGALRRRPVGQFPRSHDGAAHCTTSTPPARLTIQGGCLCGDVRFELATAPLYSYYCHCNFCRRWSGSVAGTWLTVPVADFEFTAGQASIRAHSSSPKFERKFCGTCGSNLLFTRQSAPEFLEVCHGALDAPQDWPPQNHIWTSVALGIQLDPHLPGFSEEVGGSDVPGGYLLSANWKGKEWWEARCDQKGGRT